MGYDRRGTRLLVDHLVERRIAFVGHPKVSPSAHERLPGYYDRHRADGRDVPDSLVCLVRKDGIDDRFCHNLLRTARPDGIVAIDDRTVAVLGWQVRALGRKNQS